MPSCKHCGKWAGLVDDAHQECAALSAAGWADVQIKAKAEGRYDAAATTAAAPRPLSMRHIVGGVYFGTVLAAITLGILYAIISDIARAL